MTDVVMEKSTRHPAAFDVLSSDTNEMMLKCSKCYFTQADLAVFSEHWKQWHTHHVPRMDRVRLVILEARKQREDGTMGYTLRTAEALNAAGVVREREPSLPWSPDIISRMFVQYDAHIVKQRRRVNPRGEVVDAQESLPLGEPNVNNPTHDVPTPTHVPEGVWDAILNDYVDKLRDVADRLEKAADRVVTSRLTDETRDKARRYDELQRLLGKE